MHLPNLFPWLGRARRSGSHSLGKLEAEIMERVWRRQEASVREVHAEYASRLAYTTVMTTLDRLYKKGLLSRRKQGRAFYYSARISREGFNRALAREYVGSLLAHTDQGAEAVLSYFVEAVSDTDQQLLDELERMVKSKRRSLRRSE